MGAITALCASDPEGETLVKEKTAPVVTTAGTETPVVTTAQKHITFEDFKIHGQIGEGGFGYVYLCQLKENIAKGQRQQYAVKQVSRAFIETKNVVKSAKLERAIMGASNSPFIVSLVMAFQDQSYIYLVMEYACGGDLYGLIKKDSPKLPDYKDKGETAVRFIAACVIMGLEYIHQKQIIYRDLKPENVLLCETGYVKLTDFGLAKEDIEDQINKSVLGTPLYYAPEMVLKRGYKKQLDLWCLGVFLYELSVLEAPFAKAEIEMQFQFERTCRDAEKNRNWKGVNLNPQLKSLINGLLKTNPQERLGSKSWTQVKEHAFFTDFDWKSLEEQKMESPLLGIVKKFPPIVKPYRPNMKKTSAPVQTEKLAGWTYISKKHQNPNQVAQ